MNMPDGNAAALRIHEREQSKLCDQADSSLIAQAVEALTERLKDGKRIGRCDVWDLLDNELNTDRYRVLLEELGSLLVGGKEACDDRIAADKIRDGLIERYLTAHPELVEEEVAEIERAAAEDA